MASGGESIRNRRFYTGYPEHRIPLVVEGGEAYELVGTFNVKERKGQQIIDYEEYIEVEPVRFQPASEYTIDKVAKRLGRFFKVIDKRIEFPGEGQG